MWLSDLAILQILGALSIYFVTLSVSKVGKNRAKVNLTGSLPSSSVQFQFAGISDVLARKLDKFNNNLV